MNLDQILRADLVLCRSKATEEVAILKELAGRMRLGGVPLEPTDVLGAVEKRERLGTLSMGKGIAFCHVRTEKVRDLTIGIATSVEALRDLPVPDGAGIRMIVLLMIPRKHSDLYLRALAALLEALSRPEVMERVLAAEDPARLVEAFAPDGEGSGNGRILALFSREGLPNAHLAQALSSVPPAELADLLEDLSPEERARCFGSMETARATAICRFMRLVPLTAALRRMPPEAAAGILDQFPPSRTADLLQRMKPEDQRPLLKHLGQRWRGELQALLKYPPHTAGGIMSPDVLSAGQDATVGQALQLVRAFPDRRQTDLYVVTPERRLAGRCEIHDLLGADPALPLSSVLKGDSPSVEPGRDQEELRRTLARSNLHSIPVLGADGSLLGVVTQDHLLDVVEQEADEDIQHIVGMKMEDPLHMPLPLRLRMRMPWLLLTVGGELFIALMIARYFRATLEKAVVLSAFIPVIMATGGNVGLQATTMVVRGLGMGTLKRRHTLRLILGEVRLGLLLGLICGAVAGIAAYGINWQEAEVLKISLSVFLAMLSATLATSFGGTLVPLLLHRMKMDPATACGPFVTMFNDIFGSLVYLLIAMLMNFQPPPKAVDGLAGWMPGRGNWTVAGTVIRQDAAVEDWAVLLKDGEVSGELDAQVRFKPVSGKEDASAGLILRAQDAENYYVCRANALEGNFRFYIVRDNIRTTLESAEVERPSLGSWHTLGVCIRGEVVTCALDGRVLLTHRMGSDKDPAWTSGRVGLWTKADSVTEFEGLALGR